MQFQRKLIAAVVLSVVGGGIAAAADEFPSSGATLDKDTIVKGYGDISSDVTIDGAGQYSFTIDDQERGSGASLSVTGGTTTFQNMETFTLLANHEGHGGGYAIQGLYVLHGPTIKFNNVKNIYLGTDEKPLVNTYAITAHSGTVEATGFDQFVVRSSHGLWATNSGGSSAINLDASENGVIDIQTTSFAIDVDAWDYSEGYANSQTITLNAGDVRLESTGSRAIIIGSGITGADSTLNITAANNIGIKGATHGVELYGYENGGTATFVAKAGNEITISGEEGAIVDSALDTSDKAKVDLTAPTVTFDGAVDAQNTDMALSSGTDGQAVNVNINGDFKVQSLDGRDVTINAVYDEELGTIAIGENKTEGTTNLTVTGDAASKLTRQEAIDYLESVELGKDANYSTSLENAAWGVEIEADGNGQKTTQVRATELTTSTMDIAALTMVAWRNETTNITDRMATLRTNPASFGAWARFNGGEYQYDARNVSNQFQTIEVGADAKVGNSWVLGASLSYTKGNGEFTHGESDSDTYAGALYALWTHDSGSFVDVMAKVGRLSTDFDFRGVSGVASDNGSLDQTGYIFGVETGHRFNLASIAFVEPQIQLTYSRLDSDSETTAAREIDIEATDSLIARVGVMGGLTFPDQKGSVYARVSALHDFLGDVDGTFRAVNNPESISMSEELDETWVEFAVGGDYRLGNNTFVFADIQRSAGGDIDLDWRVNLGAKFVW